MTESRTQPTAAPPEEPVRAALDDPELLNELRRHALARLQKQLADRLQAVRLQMVEDAIQETCKRALAAKDKYDPAKATVAGWLHGILNHVLSEHCRSLRKEPLQAAADPAEWASLSARLANHQELIELLASLSDEHRRIISMHHLDGMSHEQTAAVLGITVGASRARLNRAMVVARELAAKGGGR